MAFFSRKRESVEQTGSERRKRVRCEGVVNDVGDAEEDGMGGRVALSCERRGGIQTCAEEVERVCRHDEMVLTGDTDGASDLAFNPPETLQKTPSTGTKRPSAQLETDDTSDLQLKANSRAIYDANKTEINTWYDKDHTKKLGIPQHGKPKHSAAPWYQKLLVWQKAHGHVVASPRKKRKLNTGSSQAIDAQTLSVKCRQRRRLPGDSVPVPEPPFVALSDFETMPNGNYACGHVYRNPPLECCETGLSMHAKKEAIKKSKETWKKQVERLIDGGKLDPGHKEWEGWVCEGLREKNQPVLFARQKEAREKRAREREGWKRGMIEGGEVVRKRSRQSLQRPDVCHSPACPASNDAPQSPIDYHRPQPIPAFQRQSISNDIAAIQTSFLAKLVRTNPRQLRQHDVFYRHAQYRESLKESPDFGLLKKWYLAYFLKDKEQPLSAEQRELLEKEDPSYVGRKRVGIGPALAAVDSFFGEYLAQKASMPTLRAGSLTPAAASDFQDAPPAPSSARREAFKPQDPEMIESGLGRIRTSGGVFQKHVGFAVSDPVSQKLTQTRSEAYYLSSLPQSIATGNEVVDAEMRNMLLYAYQADLPPQFSLGAKAASTSCR